jgi:biopolymer transport protein ExbD
VRYPRSETEDVELHLLPFMNLMTLLIPFLLLSATFVQLATIGTTLPAITKDPAPAATESLRLTVAIDDDGYLLTGNESLFEGESRLRIPRGLDGAWDTPALAEAAVAIKEAHPSERALLLSPELDVPFEEIVAVLDATRERSVDGVTTELFPDVSVSGGVLP